MVIAVSHSSSYPPSDLVTDLLLRLPSVYLSIYSDYDVKDLRAYDLNMDRKITFSL